MKRSILIDIIAIAAIAVLISLTFFWIEAKKEVFYLCDNFYPGVSKSSVIRQLNTAELSTYDTTFIANGSRIVAYSPLHLGMMSCRIDFNKQDIVLVYGSKEYF